MTWTWPGGLVVISRVREQGVACLRISRQFSQQFPKCRFTMTKNEYMLDIFSWILSDFLLLLPVF